MCPSGHTLRRIASYFIVLVLLSSARTAMNSRALSVLSCFITSATTALFRLATVMPSCWYSQSFICATLLGLSSPDSVTAFSVSSALYRASKSSALRTSCVSTLMPRSFILASKHQKRCSVSSGFQRRSILRICRSVTMSCRLYSMNCAHFSGACSG